MYRELKNREEKVEFPQFSNNSKPNLNIWLKELEESINRLDGKITVIAHSMGVILWLYYAFAKNKKLAERLALVAPPSRSFLINNKEGNGFKDFPVDKETLKKSAEEIILIASNGDKYFPEGAIDVLGKELELDSELLEREAGHINTESGYGRWDYILEWALEGKN